MSGANLVSALIGTYGGPMLAILALAILYRRTGHGWLLILAVIIIPLGFTIIANMGLAAAVGRGWMSADIYFFALEFRGWVVPVFMLFLALKPWPANRPPKSENVENQ